MTQEQLLNCDMLWMVLGLIAVMAILHYIDETHD